MQGTAAVPSFALPLGQVVPILFYLVFFIWGLYSLIAAYHWIKYGSNKMVSISALTVHLIASCSIAIYALSGIH